MILKYTDLSADQVDNLDKKIVNKIYDWVFEYIKFHEEIQGERVIKVPSFWIQQVFYQFSEEYKRDSPVDSDHWNVNN